tara:strand:- start:1305 stop:1460 length:156 start_codon:yes stop_codon:yes gene_type:complete
VTLAAWAGGLVATAVMAAWAAPVVAKVARVVVAARVVVPAVPAGHLDGQRQ